MPPYTSKRKPSREADHTLRMAEITVGDGIVSICDAVHYVKGYDNMDITDVATIDSALSALRELDSATTYLVTTLLGLRNIMEDTHD